LCLFLTVARNKHEISYPPFVLFRKSLDEATVPDDWKCANVCPIFKKSNRNSAENYRPVSLTCQICKIFAAVILDVLVQHLENNCLIRDSQHGLRKGYEFVFNKYVNISREVDWAYRCRITCGHSTSGLRQSL